MNHYELHYPLCENEIFLFIELNIPSNLPSVLYLVLPEDVQAG